MASTNIHTVTRARLLSTWRDPAVAAEAGLSSIKWITRVMSGDKDGFIANLHRGLLPAVELFQKTDAWDFPSFEQGTVNSRWTIRVHSGLHTQESAEDQCRAIAYAGLIKARADEYFFIGDENLGAIKDSPLGYQLEIDFSVSVSADINTYETTPGDSNTGEVPDGGDVGGIRTTINFNTTSPVSLLALPAGQSLNGVQVHVITAFDGTAPTITIGVDGNQDKYMLAADSDLTEANSIWERDADDTGPQTVKVWISGTSMTQGQAVVQLSTTATG